MRIHRTFVWRDGRPDDEEEIRSEVVDHLVSHGGARFVLRSWDMRFPPGRPRVTEAVYDEIRSALSADRQPHE